MFSLLLACSGPRATVVIVGAGPAGLAAAIEAASEMSVIVLEARSELGGSASLGDAVTAIPTAAVTARLDATGTNPARTRFIERVRPDVIGWTTAFKVRWHPLENHAGDGCEVQAPHGGGVALIAALIGEAERRGVEIRRSTRVLSVDRSTPLRVRVRGTEPVDADAVILATGGFAGNLDRVREKLDLGDLPLLRGAAAFADGNGIDIATSLGGTEVSPAQVLFYGHGVPAPEDETRALMLVDGPHAYTLGADGVYLPQLQSPRGDSGLSLQAHGGQGWALMDGMVLENMTLWDADQRRFRPAEPVAKQLNLMAGRLSDLAATMNMPYDLVAAGLGATRAHDDPAHPLMEMNRYAALPLRLTTAKTLTGVRVDLDGHVVDAAGVIIPRLYAAGELAGFAHPWEGEHLDSTMVSGAILTGRAAGKAAARDWGG